MFPIEGKPQAKVGYSVQSVWNARRMPAFFGQLGQYERSTWTGTKNNMDK